jgi:peptide/nickel transport system permease protein
MSGINLDYVRHLVLPVMTLSVQIIASWSRFQRAAMLDVLSALRGEAWGGGVRAAVL